MKDSKKQYPPQTGIYTVKVKNGRGWNVYSTARLQISVGQQYHEGEKLKATVEWAKHRFDKVIICVNDTLQRYNFIYKDNLSEKEAFNISEVAGREWIERNINIIRTLPKYELYRWEDWRNREDFSAQYQDITELYHSSIDVRSLIQEDVLQFWKRRQLDGTASNINFDVFKKNSIQYLLEETAAFFLMFKKEQAVDVYPGSVLLPCVLGQKYLMEERSHLGERAFTRIDFSKNDSISTKSKAAI